MKRTRATTITNVGMSILIGILISGCASTTANLQRETAREIGDITSEEVNISEVRRGTTNVSWKATSPHGSYRCEADDMIRRVHCVKEERSQ